MSNLWQYFLFILAALVGGLLYASVSTKVTYPCPLLPGTAGCVSFEKAVMHPSDLLANYQGSLSQFLFKFLVVFVTVLALLIVVNKVSLWADKRKRHQTK